MMMRVMVNVCNDVSDGGSVVAVIWMVMFICGLLVTVMMVVTDDLWW